MAGAAGQEQPVAACRNCGHVLAVPRSRFCPQCGQETRLHPPSLREFVHEFVGHYVALEGALWKTLGLLLLRPGKLTTEYLAGRRRRYVLPLRLFISASFVFFLLVKLLAPAAIELQVQGGGTDLQVQVPWAPASEPACEQGNDCLAAKVAERWSKDPKAAGERLQSRLLSSAPYAVFLMLPVFAAIVMLVYRRRRLFYGEHVVFSLHMHSFWFLALTVLSLLPFDASAAGATVIGLYGVVALRQVYGGRWLATLARALAISLTYGAALLLASLLVLGLAFLA
jgi:hypothetical protein